MRLSERLLPGCRLVLGDDVGGHTAATGSPGRAADLAGVVNVCPQRGVELAGVLGIQVDFVVSTVQVEPDGAGSLAAVDVIDVQTRVAA